jgi:ureidoglycolate hydrolase
MKFHGSRTAVRSPLECMGAYRAAFADGRLRAVAVRYTIETGRNGVWRRLPVEAVRFRDDGSRLPLEVGGFIIAPRASVVDELTRHRSTPQVFVPVTGPILAAVAPSRADAPDRPDPERVELVPVRPGEAIEVGVGTWHTLPFAPVGDVVCMSIMHREELDAYHDVRDLAAEGWIGLPEWIDPEEPG